jgi:hypothetical protein
MTCWFGGHNWGWPRRRSDCDVQVCVRCGASRVSVIQFAGAQPPEGAAPALTASGEMQEARQRVTAPAFR